MSRSSAKGAARTKKHSKATLAAAEPGNMNQKAFVRWANGGAYRPEPGAEPKKRELPVISARWVKQRSGLPRPAGDVSRIRFVGYSRYSTKGQREPSIKRQEKKQRSYVTTCQGKYLHNFADRAKTGTEIAGRTYLLRCMELAQQDEPPFDAVVVENIDRLARKLLDGMDIFRVFFDAGIEVHCATRKKKLSATEAAEAFADAQRDLEKTKERLKEGRMSLIEEGRIPFKPGWGFELVDGQPGVFQKDVKVEKHAKELVKRGIRGEYPGPCVAWLNAEGVEPPGHADQWYTYHVHSVWKNPMIAGHVIYNRTETTKTKETPKSKKKTTRRQRPRDEWEEDYAERIAYCSPDEFDIIQSHIGARAFGGGRKRLPARTSFLWSGRIFCACGRPLKIHEDYRSKRSYARCNSTKRHGRDDTRNIPLRILEPWILDTLERTIPGEAIQRHYLQAVRNSQEAIERSHRDGCERLRKEIDEKEELYNRSWRRDLTQGISGARLAEFRQEQEAEIESLKTELFELERSRPTKLEINEKAVEAMPDMLALIRSRSPFKPRDLYERRVAAAIKMLTPSIKIGFEGGNHYTLSLTMRPLAVAAANFKADNLNDLETTTVELKYNGEYGFAMPFRYSAKTDLQAEHQKMAKAGKFALTDKQWQKLQPHCPPHLDKTIDQRKTVDALIFTLAAEISFMYAPPFFGDRPDVYAAMRRFIWGGGIEAIQRCFADDEFIRRLNFSRWKGIRRSPLVQEPVRDDRLMDWKPFRLTDPEWSEIAHLVPDSAINSLGKKVIEKRDLVDAIVVKVRSGTSWPTIPSELGDDRVIFRAILRLVRCGAWDRILFALLNKFPAKYEPFIWPDYVGRKRSAGSWRWKKENLDPRLAAIKRDKAVA